MQAHKPDFKTLPVGSQYEYFKLAASESSAHVLGKGSESTVYMGRRVTSSLAGSNWVAVKRSNNSTHLRYTSAERAILQRLRDTATSSEFLLQYLDYVEAEGEELFVMEVGIGSLRSRFEPEIAKFPIGDDEILETLRSLCNSVQVLHDNGIAHRDIRPANFIIMPNGAIRLADFGLSRTFNMDQSAASSNFTLSQGWDLQPPEAREAKAKEEKVSTRSFSTRVDIFMLGMTMFYFASRGGELVQPRDSQRGASLSKDEEKAWWENHVDEQLKARIKDIRLRFLLSNMLCYDPEKRFNIDRVLSHPYFTDFHGLRTLTDEFFSKTGKAVLPQCCRAVESNYKEILIASRAKRIPQLSIVVKRSGIAEVLEYMRHGLAHYIDSHWDDVRHLMLRDDETGDSWKFAGEYFFRHSATGWVLPAIYAENAAAESAAKKEAKLQAAFRFPGAFQSSYWDSSDSDSDDETDDEQSDGSQSSGAEIPRFGRPSESSGT